VFALNREQFLVALEQIITGIIQKFLFAMLIDSLVVQPWSHKPFTLTVGVVMSIAYSAYLYFDFAGYSNMAIGAGRLFGLNIPANFNMPLLAKTRRISGVASTSACLNGCVMWSLCPSI
jgi:membrane protein involved in D-alanine export